MQKYTALYKAITNLTNKVFYDRMEKKWITFYYYYALCVQSTP